MPDSSPSAGRTVLMIGSEAVPFSKTGGLADVLGALPLALARLDCQVTLVVPRYRGVTAGTHVEDISLKVGGKNIRVGFFEAALGSSSVRVILVDVPELYDRDGIYASGTVDYPDSPLRFGVLCRAALEWAVRRGVRPDVVHAHDWQGGLAPAYIATAKRGSMLAGVPSVFTIHNLAYQGLCGAEWIQKLDLPQQVLSQDGAEFWGRLSLLKAGINYSSAITTVSPRYAQEIQTPELGFGFDGVLRRRASSLQGVLNGIDVEQWDPARDPYLPAHFTADDLSGKRKIKEHLLERLGLPRDATSMRRPLIGMISRLVDQKGFDLIAELSGELATLDAVFAVLGTGDPRYEKMWLDQAARLPDRIRVKIGFDEEMAHQIEGGSDMFLMPSKFEPCGLNQMYSLRYGTVPVVREVGGLADTVRHGVTGFVFREYSAAALLQSLRDAIAAFADKPRWQAMQVAGMAEDHSWDRSAREYVRIYEAVGVPA